MHSEKLSFLLDKLAYFAEIERSKLTTSPLFGYTGIHYEHLLFGAIYQSYFYLKTDEKLIAFIESLEEFNINPLENLQLKQGAFSKQLHYFKIPNEIWENKSLFKRLIQLAIDLHKEDLMQIKQDQAQKLRSLPNITFSLERSLCKIGITNVAQFQQIGVFETFYQLEKAHKNKMLSHNILFHLHGALKKINSYRLNFEEKNTLLDAYFSFAKTK